MSKPKTKSKKIPAPLSESRLRATIDKAVSLGKVEMADQAEIFRHVKYVDKLLEHMGHDPMNCFVSDESSIGDFQPDLKKLSKKLGFEVKNRDLLWEVARRMGAN